MAIGIIFETLTGKKVSLTVEPTDTIEQVKEYLEEKEGIPPAQQNLIFNTKLLGINLTVEECGITEGSVVSLVLTLRGGA